MERFADGDSVCPVRKDKSSCPLQVQEMFLSFPESIEPPDQPNTRMQHGKRKHAMRITNNQKPRPSNTPEGQPFAQHVSLSDERTKSTADVVQSLPAPPSTLTCVKSEPLAEESPPEASVTSLSAILVPPVQPSPPVARNTTLSTKPASKKRNPRAQANKTALGVSVQPLHLASMKPFRTPGVTSIASTSTSALMWFPESSVATRSDVLLPSQMTEFSLDIVMNQSMDNNAGYPAQKARTRSLAVVSNPSDPAFRKTGPTTSASTAASVTNTLSYGSVCNDGSSLLLPTVSAPATGVMNSSLENMVGLPTHNVQAPLSASKSSEPAAMQAIHPPPITSSTLAATPLQTLVYSLVLNFQQEDAIRSRIFQLDQSITSVLATLNRLKKQRQELQVSEAHTKKRRMEVLQCLQKATVSIEENPAEQMLPGKRMTTAAVPPPYADSGANQAFVAPQIPQGASAFAFGQATEVQTEASEMFNFPTGAPTSQP